MSKTIVLVVMGIVASLQASVLNAGRRLALESSETQVHLIELFSTESCSSCPPADRWIGELRNSSSLWKSFVPVVAHVDYWDYLGWKDPYSSKENTLRQKKYVRDWNGGYAYTPNFVLNGNDWRRRSSSDLNVKSKLVGVLRAEEKSPGKYMIRFTPSGKSSGQYVVHGAIMGNGIEVDVRRGENSGKKLKHNFLTIDYESSAMTKLEKNTFISNLALDSSGDKRASSYSVAFWVSKADSPKPLQAVGGDL